MRRTFVALLLLAVAVPLAASEAPPCSPDLATLLAAPAQTPAELPAELGTPETVNLSACTDDCYQQMLFCLDDCDAWPYPGCNTDCRNARFACNRDCH